MFGDELHVLLVWDTSLLFLRNKWFGYTVKVSCVYIRQCCGKEQESEHMRAEKRRVEEVRTLSDISSYAIN